MKRQYKYILKPLSLYSDIFSADTLFGTVCWYVKYLYGENTLISLLNEYDNSIPIIISSLMPQGYMYMPHLTFTLKDSISDIENDKKLKNLKWIPLEVFKKYQKDYNQDLLVKELNIPQIEKIEPGQIDITRNSISRITGMVREGVLFTDSYYYNNMDSMCYNVYVTEFDDSYSDIFQNAFVTACQMGFGSDASTGKGIFDVKIDELDSIEKSIFGYQGKYFVTLSDCAGQNLEPLCYTTITKYGKLGGEFSQIGINGQLLFNKKPIVLYKAGSTFFTTNGKNGKLLNNIHTDYRIRQYAFAYPVYFDYSSHIGITT